MLKKTVSLRTRTTCNCAVATAKCPSGAAAIGVAGGQLKSVRASGGTRGNTGSGVEARRSTRCQSAGLVSRIRGKIRFLRNRRISQVGFDLSLMTTLSVRCELRDRNRRQNTDDGDHHQQFYKRKTGFTLKSQSIHFLSLPLG